MSLQEELEALENDIASLQAEIGPLQEQYDQVFREVSAFEAENTQRKHAWPVVPKRVSQPTNNDIDDAPALIHHSHFDVSIERYFKDSGSKTSQQDSAATNDEILAKIQLKTIAGQLALKESIFRFGGITAFAINDRLYDTEDDALLGLRFDVLSHVTHQFLKPHYIILRRRQVSTKDGAPTANRWSIFRYTTPPYVPLDQLRDYLMHGDESSGLQKFVEKVRESLVSVQYKHDKFESLSNLTYAAIFESGSDHKVISKLEKDLECKRILLRIKNTNSVTKLPLHISLICGNVDLVGVDCKFGEEKSETFVQSMLQGCSFQNLGSAFKDVVKYLRKNDVL